MIDLKCSSANKVFAFFAEISRIPRGSGNTEAIADYLVSFAKERGLEFYRDKSNNIIIKKSAAVSCKSRPTVILQGHTDMVLAKAEGIEYDFKKGIKLIFDNDFIRADGTTLGADNGIAVAYMLALLDSEDIPHPAIEAVFTSDEEIGLLGAAALDCSHLSGKIMINLDSDEEGVFTVGCAGGRRIDISFPLEYEGTKAQKYTILLDGLLGGHSGVMINEGRTNAIKRISEYLTAFDDIKLVNISGGAFDNAIPDMACAEFISSLTLEELSKIINNLKNALQKDAECENITLKISDSTEKAINEKSTKKLLSLINALPFGVIKMNCEIPEMVETSVNIGIISASDTKAEISLSIRSSKDEEKELLANKIKDTARLYGAEANEHGDYPGWEYKRDSHIRNIMCKIYRDTYGKEARVITIHAGLECGLFSKKVENLDSISIGPDAFDIHTPNEKLSVSSTERVWEFLLKVLKNI